MSKTEISAKILKSWKNKSFYYHNTQKINQHTSRVGLFLWTKYETNPWSSSSSREWYRILAAILDFVEEAEKSQKNTGQIP